MTPTSGSLQGELGVLSLFDLGQLLMMNRVTGCLAIQSRDKKGFLYFEQGRLVNAVDDAFTEGENAACAIFTWRTGTFEFRPELPQGKATIQIGTDALMMEAARRMDEASLVQGATATPKLTARLQERQGAMEKLRDAFKRAAGDADAVVAEDGVPPSSVHLYSLSRPGDRLVYRPGHPPRLRQNNEWCEPHEEPAALDDYKELRAWLLEACNPLMDYSVGSGHSHRLDLADGRIIALDLVNEGMDEALWLRPIDLPAPDPAKLEGDVERLNAILELAQGVIVVGGVDLDSVRRLFHAIIGLMLAEQAESILLASSDGTYQHREPEGVLVRTLPQALHATLRTVQPDVVALDPGLFPDEVQLADLELVPRVLAGVVGVDVGALMARWLMRLGSGDLQRPQNTFASTPISLVMAHPMTQGTDSILFSAWRLSERERVLALRGESAALSPILIQGAMRERPPAVPPPKRKSA